MAELSRRRFIGTSASAIVGGVLAVSAQPGRAIAGPLGESAEDSGAANQGIYRSVASVGNKVFALISVNGADGIYRLDPVGKGLLKATDRIAVTAPDGFLALSLGSVGGDLVVGGGRDVVWATYEVDDDIPEDLETEFTVIPGNIPRGGKRTVVEVGTVPHVIRINDGVSTQVKVVANDSRAHEFVLALGSTTASGLTMLMGHSADFDESLEAVELEVALLTASDDIRAPIAGRLAHNTSVSLAVGNADSVVMASMVGGQTALARRSQEWQVSWLEGVSQTGERTVVIRDDGSVAVASLDNGTLEVKDVTGLTLGASKYTADAVAVFPVGRGSEVVIVKRDTLMLVDL